MTSAEEVVAAPAEISRAGARDYDELFAAYTQIVDSGAGFPHEPPLTREAFDEYWIAHSSAVWIVRLGGVLVGAYYVKPNFVGRAAHIANAGYFLLEPYRGHGLGRRLVEHSLHEARRLGFDAMQFNLVFASNPARHMYRAVGFSGGGPDTGRRGRGGGRDLLAQPRGGGTVSEVSVDAVGEHVWAVCLHRPPNNFFDTAPVGALADAYEELAAGTSCRAIVLRSEGKHFCAGLDFANNKEQDIAALYRNALRIFAAPLPVVAAVQGGAIGGGLGLALSADFRIATPGSRFAANFSRLGFHHGFGLDGHPSPGGG